MFQGTGQCCGRTLIRKNSGRAGRETNMSGTEEVPASVAMLAARTNSLTLGPTGRPRVAFPPVPSQMRISPAHVIAVVSQKGGVGKTTTTVSLGASLAEAGLRVLVVDMDPQGALSAGLGANPMSLERTVYDLLLELEPQTSELLLDTPVPGLRLLPANIDLSAAEVQLMQEVGRERALERVLAPVLHEFDIVLVDCQPSLGLLTINALTCANEVLIPLVPEYFAMRGVALLVDTIEKVRKRINPKLQIGGILATMFDSRPKHSREVMERMLEVFGDSVYHTVITRAVRFPESTAAGEPITVYAPTSASAASYRTLAREVIHSFLVKAGERELEPQAQEEISQAEPIPTVTITGVSLSSDSQVQAIHESKVLDTHQVG
jgi:chromosome partitioning protein